MQKERVAPIVGIVGSKLNLDIWLAPPPCWGEGKGEGRKELRNTAA